MSSSNNYSPRFEYTFLTPRYWPTWLGLGLLRIYHWLPRSLSAFLGARLGDLVYLFHHKRRHIARVNLQMCFPDMPARQRKGLLRRHLQQYALCVLDYGLIWWKRPQSIDRVVTIKGLDKLKALTQSGRNVILLSGHLVGLDVGGTALARHFKLASLVKRGRNPIVDWLMTRGRLNTGAEVFLRDDGIRPVIRSIRQGRLFYYLPDEDLGGEKSIFVPFFATESATLTALGRMARIADASVVPCFTRRLPGNQGYEVEVQDALEHFPGGDELADTMRMKKALQDYVARYPDQYMWTFKMFKHRPDGVTDVYRRSS